MMEQRCVSLGKQCLPLMIKDTCILKICLHFVYIDYIYGVSNLKIRNYRKETLQTKTLFENKGDM